MPIRLLLPTAVLAIAGVLQAHADDQKRARTWVEEGRILPLAELLGRLPPDLDGRLLEAEFEVEHGRPIYELEWLTADGRVLELEIDARDGTLLRSEVDD